MSAITLDVRQRALAAAAPKQLGRVAELVGLHLRVTGLQAAIGDLLEADSTLATLAPGGVWFGMVTDQEVEGPFCIFNMASETEQWAMGSSGIQNGLWLVKGAGEDAEAVEDIDLRCRELLHGASLGVGSLFTRRVEGVEYSEDSDGQSIFYKGSNYKVAHDVQ